MTEIETAWLAGILEGEGCFYFKRTPMVKLSMTDEDVVERAAKLVGKQCRKANRPTVSGKSVYLLEIHGEKAIRLMESILPYMGGRRSNKIREVLIAAASRPGVAKGSRQGSSVLDESIVSSIRAEYAADQKWGAQSRIARRHGLPRRTVAYALSGVTYKVVS